MSAAVVRAQMLAEDKAPGADTAAELADAFCRGARRRVIKHFRDLMDNDDNYNYDAAQKVLEGRYEWLEAGVVDPATSGPQLKKAVDAVLKPKKATAAGAKEGAPAG